VAHYTGALLSALATGYPDDEWRVLLPRGVVAPVPAGVLAVRSTLPGRLLHGSAAAVGRPRADRMLGGDLDVFWAPAPAPLAVSRGTPLVLTVHDRSWEERPGDFTPYERAWHRAARPKALARRATRVLCDAEVVRADLVRAWGLPPERVRAVPLAPAAGLERAPASAPPQYLLFVGALEPRKAPDVLLAAYALARSLGVSAELWFAGEGRLAPLLEGPGVRRLGRVDDAELAGLYAGAVALVLPSRIEGFGLPPVEALAQGTPVVASDLPVLREVLGEGGALFVGVGDEKALAEALIRVTRDAGLRSSLAAAGRRATAGLSWAATAQATREVLAEASRRPSIASPG
jgi:glycosyltransferase involved in cell wall biosynthesis